MPASPSDGRSFLPLLQGEKQSGRDHVFAQFYHIHGADALPMRSVLTRDVAYVFNPWSNGQRIFKRNGGPTFRAMRDLAKANAAMQARVQHMQFRTVEEFFDLRTDPGCIVNLLGSDADSLDVETKGKLEDARKKLRHWMVQHKDSALHAFDHRDQPEALETFMRDYRKRAAQEVEALKPYEKQQGFRF